MAERVEAEIVHMKEKREAYSAAVGLLKRKGVSDRHMRNNTEGLCRWILRKGVQYSISLRRLGVVFVSFIRTAQNAKVIDNENSTLTQLNKQVNVLRLL